MFSSDHIALYVHDLSVSRNFYEYLGGRVVSKASPHFVEIMLGSQRLHLVLDKGEAKGPVDGIGINHFCLQVPQLSDLAAFAKRLEACELIAHLGGIIIEDSPMLGDGLDHHCEERPPLKTLYFKDPDSINIEVRAYK